MRILIINGPNLNLLGKREPGIYGSQSFEDYLQLLREKNADIELDYYQSNVEGELINKLHSAEIQCDAVVLNAGAYTHTSIAISDAIGAISIPVVEVHISCILSREPMRHVSLIAPKCIGSIMGFGLMSYDLGISAIKNIKK